jgi:hypothetical protein
VWGARPEFAEQIDQPRPLRLQRITLDRASRSRRRQPVAQHKIAISRASAAFHLPSLVASNPP